MADGRFAILDPAAGISGDMLLGALVAAGAPADWLRGLPARLGIPDVTVAVDTVDRCGVRATKVDCVPSGRLARAASRAGAAASDQHVPVSPTTTTRTATTPTSGTTHGPHRHVGELIAMVERAPLSAWVRERAVRAFTLLGEAEAQVHGVPADQVALHEVGAMDALVDIVGGIEGFERLGIARIFNRPVGVGDGWVRAAHGIIPVPAPATAILLEGIEVGPNGPVSGRGHDADRRRAASGALGGRSSSAVAAGGRRCLGRGRAEPRVVPERASADPRGADGRGGRGGAGVQRPRRPEPGVSRSAPRGA